MRYLLLFMAVTFASCKKSDKGPKQAANGYYSYTCTLYNISDFNGDTTIFMVQDFPMSLIPPQDMEDTLTDRSPNTDFTICQ